MDNVNVDIGPALEFITAVGGEVADVVQLITTNRFGAFLLGAYVVATFARGAWARVRHGQR